MADADYWGQFAPSSGAGGATLGINLNQPQLFGGAGGAVMNPLIQSAVGGTMMPTDPTQPVQGPSGPSITPSAPTSPSQPPSGGNLQDPAYAAQLVSYYASQPGANPSLKNDPNYWIGKITSGELGPDVKYIVSKFMQPEGAPAGSGGGSGGGVGGQYPYGQYGQPFTMPSTADFQGSPGFQWAVKQGQNAIQNSAAAKGTLLTGGTLKALAGYTTGAADQDYNNYFNQRYAVDQGNYGIWRNNQNDTSQWQYNWAALGKPGS